MPVRPSCTELASAAGVVVSGYSWLALAAAAADVVKLQMTGEASATPSDEDASVVIWTE